MRLSGEMSAKSKLEIKLGKMTRPALPQAADFKNSGVIDVSCSCLNSDSGP